jgi:hypothetical protein
MNATRTGFMTLAATLTLSVGMLFGSPAAHAHGKKTDIEMCHELDGGARGLCRAAIRSGCAAGGRHAESRHCSKLETAYRRQTDGDHPVWLEPDGPPVVSGPITLGDL